MTVKLQMKLSGETINMIDYFERLLLKDSITAGVSKGYLFSRALHEIESKNVDWEKVRDEESIINNSRKQGVQTALIIGERILDELNELQKSFKDIFGAKRIYRPYVVKLVFKAAILNREGITIVKSEECLNGFSILQQNIDTYNGYVNLMMNELLIKDTDIMFFEEYTEDEHKIDIRERLEQKGYNVYMPMAYELSRDKGKMICILAVKRHLEFKGRNCKHIGMSLRYIMGTIADDQGRELELFLMHVPQTSIKRNTNFTYKEVLNYQERVEGKAEMLFAAYQFCKENHSRNAFIGGDLNTELNGTTRLEFILEALCSEFIDTTNKEKTWNNYRFDYALVSPSLGSCKSELIKTTSDHSAILTRNIYL